MTRWLVLVVAMLPLAGCDGAPSMLFGKRIDGVVLDADTNQPVSGAYVTYRWEGEAMGGAFSGHNAPVICYHAAAAVTDAQGRFHIEPWEKKPTYKTMNEEPYAEVYARGYAPEQTVFHGEPRRGPRDHPNDVIRVKKSSATGDARLAELDDATKRSCSHGTGSQRALYPMLKAALEEAKQTTHNDQQSILLQAFKERAAAAYLAPDPVRDGRKSFTEIKEFTRNNLQ
jgi:hypothetical protein